jgi:hypothetical protein
MPKIQFIGRITPPFSGRVVSGDLIWKDIPGRTGLEATFKIIILGAVVIIDVNSNRCEDLDRDWLSSYAFRFAIAQANLLSFASGVGFSFVLETVLDENGMPNVFVPHDSSLGPLCTVYALAPNDSNLAIIQDIVMKDSALRTAINDLIECIRAPDVAFVNCGRVVDSIRRMITPSETTSLKMAWKAMQHALNISQGYQEFISKNSTSPRHGGQISVPVEVQREVAQRAWRIMNRFLEFRKRGNIPLIAPEFPMLS